MKSKLLSSLLLLSAVACTTTPPAASSDLALPRGARLLTVAEDGNSGTLTVPYSTPPNQRVVRRLSTGDEAALVPVHVSRRYRRPQPATFSFGD